MDDGSLVGAGGIVIVGVMLVKDGEGAGVSSSRGKGCRVSKKRGTKKGEKVGSRPPMTGTGTGRPNCRGVGDGV